MNYKNLIIANALVLAASVANAGALGANLNDLAYAGEAGTAIANGLTGGVSASNVKANGSFEGNATNVAEGEEVKAKTAIGSNRGVTAKYNVEAQAWVRGNVTNVAKGKNVEASMAVGSNGN